MRLKVNPSKTENYIIMIRSSRGISTMEALIGIAMLGAIALVVTRMDVFSRNRTPNIRRECESIISSAIGAVKQDSAYRTVINFMPVTAGARSATAAQLAGITLRSVPTPANYFNAADNSAYVVSTNADSPTLNNSTLIVGMLRNLTAIYNNNAGLRCAYGVYAPLTPASLGVQGDVMMMNPVVEINIQTYNRADGSLIACGNQIEVKPGTDSAAATDNAFTIGSGNEASNPTSPTAPAVAAGNADPQYQTGYGAGYAAVPGAVTAVGGKTIATQSAFGTTNQGIILRARGQVTFNGATVTCETSEKFEYPTDNTRPNPPNSTTGIFVTSNTSFTPGVGPANNCGVSPIPAAYASAVITIGYYGADTLEQGSQLICRDISWFPGWRNYTGPDGVAGTADDNAGSDSAPCNQVAGAPMETANENAAGRPQHLSQKMFPPNGSITVLAAGAIDDSDSPADASFANRGSWFPCDQLRICGGIAPTSAALAVNPANSQQPNLRLVYTNTLPAGCVIRFQVVAVDTAGNRSNTATYAGQADLQDVIFRPTCGNAATGGAFHIANRGTFCRPHNPDSADPAVVGVNNETRCWTAGTSFVDIADGLTKTCAATPTGQNYWTMFPNGYYTCRGAFGGTGGISPNGCCIDDNDPATASTCTPWN